MWVYGAARIGQSLLALWGVTSAVFALIRLSGNPAALFMSTDTSPEQAARIRESLGLNDPLAVQYLSFIKDALTGEFGTSLRFGQPAMAVVMERLGPTLLLASTGLALSVVVGVALGIIAATRRGGIIDKACMGSAVMLQGIPTFVLAILLIGVFAVALDLLPVSGAGTPAHLILPAVSVGAYSLARLARLTRSAMVEILQQDYIRTAQAKGFSQLMVIYKHGLKNAAITIVTTIGFTFATFISGAVITETIFAWPGIGRLTIQAVTQRDFPVLQAAIVVIATLVIVVNLVTDLICAMLDPRTRSST